MMSNKNKSIQHLFTSKEETSKKSDFTPPTSPKRSGKESHSESKESTFPMEYDHEEITSLNEAYSNEKSGNESFLNNLKFSFNQNFYFQDEDSNDLFHMNQLNIESDASSSVQSGHQTAEENSIESGEQSSADEDEFYSSATQRMLNAYSYQHQPLFSINNLHPSHFPPGLIMPSNSVKSEKSKKKNPSNENNPQCNPTISNNQSISSSSATHRCPTCNSPTEEDSNEKSPTIPKYDFPFPLPPPAVTPNGILQFVPFPVPYRREDYEEISDKSESSDVNNTNSSKKKCPVNPIPEIYQCPYGDCRKKFSRYNSLKTHIAQHEVSKKFFCYQCPSSFRRAHDLKRHIISIHERTREYICDICGKVFSRMDALKRHVTRPTSNCKDHYFSMDT